MKNVLVQRSSQIRATYLSCLLLAGCLLAACGSSDPSASDGAKVVAGFDRPIALMQQWDAVRIDRAVTVPEIEPQGLLTFDDDAVEWSAVQGIEDLRVEDGKLVGRAASDTPVIALKTGARGDGDDLWAAKIKLRASAGTQVSMHTPLPDAPMGMNLGRVAEWPLKSALIPGDEATTYTVELDKVFLYEMPPRQQDIDHVLVRPTNEAGAEFAIESIRMVFRREHLASISSGPGWHGLSEIFREALVTRAPEAVRFEVDLPERPWLDLSIGSLEESGTTFRVNVREGETSHPAAELQVDAADQWKQTRVELGEWAGKTVEIELAVEAEDDSLAFWGHPTIRNSLPEGDTERPRAVIVFLGDTLRPDRLDAWGHDRETAPNLLRLAAEGVRFKDTIAQATWTKVSVPSIMTSLYPLTTNVIDLNDRVGAGETTLAEAFREAGYATFATSSVPFSGQLTNLHQGVEVLHEFGAIPTGEDEYQAKTAKHWVSTFLKWLEIHRDVPVFAFIHAMDPHSPFKPEAPYDTMWSSEEDAERFAKQADTVRPKIKSPLMQRFMAPTRQELADAGVDAESFVQHELNWYDGSIRGMDTQLGRLVRRLEESQIAQNSLIAFVTDHGEGFLEHDLHWHGNSVYGELTNVPFVLWGQGVPANVVVEQTVSNLDVYPTLLELAGLPIPERAQGRSLVPLMNGAELRLEPVFSQHVRNGEQGGYVSYAVIADGWKLIWHESAPKDLPEYELFDHAADPLNLTDVAEEHPETVEKLAETIRNWRSWAEAQQLDEEAALSEMSAEELERLRSLGYVE